MNNLKLCYDGNKALICSFFIDALETMKVKVFEGRAVSGDGLVPRVKQAPEEIQNF